MSDRSRNISYFAITLTIGALLSIVIARSYIGTRSGFLTLDEALYFYSVLLSRDAGRFVPVYGSRLAFQGILLLYSVALGINNVFSFLLLGPALPGLFSVGTILVTYKITKLLRFSQTVRALTILSMPLFFVFSLMTGFILSESPALFITMVGIYTFLRGQANGDRKSVFGSIAFFVGATLVRETFLLYTLAPIGTLLYSSVRTRNRAAALGLVSTMPTLFWGVSCILWTAPVQTAILFDTLANYSTGVIYGWGPFLLASVFLVGAWMVYSVLRRQQDLAIVFIMLVVLLSQMTLLVEYYIVSAAHGINLVGFYSSLMRFSFAGLPGAFVSIPFVVTVVEQIEERLRGWRLTDLVLPKRKIGTRFLAAIILLSLAWNIWQAPTLLSYSQSVLQNAPYEITSTTASTGESGKTMIGPTDRFASNYQSQPLRLYRKVTEVLNKHPGVKVLVIGCCLEAHMLRARVFLHEYRNVTIILPPDDKTTFCRLAASYNYTYLFAETFAYYNDTLPAAPRYYVDVLANRTTPKIRLEWENTEGYLYYVIPTGNIQTQEQYYVIPICPAATLSKRDHLQSLSRYFRPLVHPLSG